LKVTHDVLHAEENTTTRLQAMARQFHRSFRSNLQPSVTSPAAPSTQIQLDQTDSVPEAPVNGSKRKVNK